MDNDSDNELVSFSDTEQMKDDSNKEVSLFF